MLRRDHRLREPRQRGEAVEVVGAARRDVLLEDGLPVFDATSKRKSGVSPCWMAYPFTTKFQYFANGAARQAKSMRERQEFLLYASRGGGCDTVRARQTTTPPIASVRPSGCTRSIARLVMP